MKKSIVLVFVVLLICSGCAYFQKNGPQNAAPPKQEGPNQVFYGFPDVPVPKELTVVSEKSFIYETPTFRAGILFLSGNVEFESLENYFKVSMPKNGWRYINSFRYKDVVMNYVKEDKTCTIKVSPGAFTTEVEIWIGPSDKGMTQKPNEPIK